MGVELSSNPLGLCPIPTTPRRRKWTWQRRWRALAASRPSTEDGTLFEHGLKAIDRALNVLECLSQSRKGYSVSELSRRLALPKSSVHLILRTLERRGYLQKQSAGGRYKFGMKLIALSRTALDGVELRDEARPALAALAQRTGLTVHMGVLERSASVTSSSCPASVHASAARRRSRPSSKRRSAPASWGATMTAPSGR